ncbi:MAG: major capsid protein [Desulfovibrionaceae bacterium]
MDTFNEIAIHQAKLQAKVVDNITNKSPILKEYIKWMESTHGMWHAYEKLESVDGAAFVDFNAPLGEVKAEGKILRVDLGVIGGKRFVPEDTAVEFGGPDKYFAKHEDVILRESLKNAERHILYNNFKAFAINTGQVVSAGASGPNTFTMLFVHFEEGECCGIYNPNGFKKSGELLDVKPINGGNLYTHPDTGVEGYGVRYKGYFGMLLAQGTPYVRAIVNIDATHIPTEIQIDDALAEIDADEGNSFIFSSQKVRTLLKQYKREKVRYSGNETNIEQPFNDWDGVKLVTSRNFLKTGEAATAL